MPLPRFQRIYNFRDYGGYPAGSGRLVIGKLFRSGHHYNATPTDLRIFGEHQVQTVIDLRGDSERSAFPCARAKDFLGEVLFASGETGGLRPQLPHADPEDEAAVHRRVVAIYQALPFKVSLVAGCRLFLSALAERSGASMVHCFAGKDRTGIAVALVHTLTGVHSDDIMEDYLRSNDEELLERRMMHEAEHVRALLGPLSDAALRQRFSVHPSYLEAAFQAIEDRYGSVVAYAAAQLGLTTQRLEALHERLVV